MSTGDRETEERTAGRSDDCLLLDAGSGGRASEVLIRERFARHFGNPILDVMDDAALLHIEGPLAVSTDSYTVTPLFFPGGSIGSLAVHGTVNDVSMLGAEPLYLTCGFILEEGLSLEVLDRVVADMAAAARRSGVAIVTGDTKVVPRGACDRIFVNTTGIGRVLKTPSPSGHNARPGDVVLVSGSVGDHGLTILQAREGLEVASDVKSDSAPLNALVRALLEGVPEVHVLRDPTRGGLATTLKEIADQSGVGVELKETDVPVHDSVRDGCRIFGIDPLYLANEGKCICIVPEEHARKALEILRSQEFGSEAAIVGRVVEDARREVTLVTRSGGSRRLRKLEGAQLPRIC